jgi:D-aminopeptidase
MPFNEKRIRKRARELGIVNGILTPGAFNAITDVAGVKVGHCTVIEGDDIRTGITAILPHSGNLFRKNVPAAIHAANGFGKLIGQTQVEELGVIETPILLTNTLNAPRVADCLIEYMISLPGNEDIKSINPVVGETNDGKLNDIRRRVLGIKEVTEAIDEVKSGMVKEGCVGAGTGSICFGFKGGIGTSSRVLPGEAGGYTVGVLVQTNFGGILHINGAPVGRELGKYYTPSKKPDTPDGSCVIVVATDAPIGSRELKRLARRAILGMARTGSICAADSGDYVIAFSTAGSFDTRLSNSQMTPLFLAVVEAAEEAIYNSLFMASSMTGVGNSRVEAIDLDDVVKICEKYKALDWDKRFPKK